MEDVIVPFAVAAITPLGCAWVASRFVPPTNKWIYGSVIIGTAFLSWKYIVPRMLTSMGYPVPFEAESFSAQGSGLCPICKGDVFSDMELGLMGYQISYCSSCDLSIHDCKGSCVCSEVEGKNEIPLQNVFCECGFGQPYGSSMPCESCEPIAEKIESHNKKYAAETKDYDCDYQQVECGAESFAADSEGCSECLFQDEGDDREYIYGPMIYYYGSGGYRHIPNANFCYTCGAEIEKPQTGWVAESFEGESKFIEPLIRKGKIDLSRDYKGRYRRKLSIPLKKK